MKIVANNLKEPKFNKGDKLIFDGLVGIVQEVHFDTSGDVKYVLAAEIDANMSCTAPEDECELFVDQELDQETRLKKAKIDSAFEDIKEFLDQENNKDE